MTIKTNPDYSASAVNLHLALPEVKEALASLKRLEADLEETQEGIENLIPENLRVARDTLEEQIAQQQKFIKDLIDVKGSFQDVDQGIYAVKQLKQSWEYNPEVFLIAHPASTFGRVRNMVIKETVDVTALNGLIKGKILDEQDLKNEGVIVPGKQTFSYIIKTGE